MYFVSQIDAHTYMIFETNVKPISFMFPVARSMTNYFVILTMVWLGTIYEFVTQALELTNMVDLLGLVDLELTRVEAGLFLETYGASIEGILEFVQR